jgi:hypothetical protein
MYFTLALIVQVILCAAVLLRDGGQEDERFEGEKLIYRS